MEKSTKQKEHLLAILLEIEKQLADLERALEMNYSELGKAIVMDQSEKLEECERRINELEGTIAKCQSKTRENHFNSNPGYKTNMGFKLGF
jgi:exodeoxyribonuclease VII small subunit